MIDPLTLEVFWSRLIAVVDEQATALIRTAFSPTVAEAGDIGGRPFSADARELFEEGLFIPVTKLFAAGQRNEELIKLLRANVREPDAVVGDLYAMTAANDVGGARLLEFMAEFGLESIEP